MSKTYIFLSAGLFLFPSLLWGEAGRTAGTTLLRTEGARPAAMGKSFVQSIDCVPLEVRKEILGFCFNRVWRAIKRETLYMWADGFVDFKDIDRAWMIFTGMPVTATMLTEPVINELSFAARPFAEAQFEY